MAQQDLVSIIKGAASKFGVPENVMMHTARRESNFNPNAKNPASTAEGLYQFIDATWMNTLRRYGGAAGLDETASKRDPQASAMMAAALMAENRSVINSLVGRDATEGELYLAHFLGGRGAVNMILATEKAPDAPAAAIFPAAAVSNPSVFYDAEGMPRSVKDVYAQMTSMDGKLPDSVPVAAEGKPAAEKPAETKGEKAIDVPSFTPVAGVGPAVQKIAGPSRGESEIERVAARVGAKRGLMG